MSPNLQREPREAPRQDKVASTPQGGSGSVTRLLLKGLCQEGNKKKSYSRGCSEEVLSLPLSPSSLIPASTPMLPVLPAKDRPQAIIGGNASLALCSDEGELEGTHIKVGYLLQAVFVQGKNKLGMAGSL